MKRIYLVGLILLVIFQFNYVSGQNGVLNILDQDVDFELARCGPYSLEIFENQYDRETGFQNDRIAPENLILDLNVSSLINGSLKIYSHISYINEDDQEIFSLDSELIESQSNYSLNIRANQAELWFSVDESSYKSLVYGSIHGVYRLYPNSSLPGDWKQFSLFECYPSDMKIYDTGNNVHNLSIQLNLTEIRNGTLNYYFTSGVWDGLTMYSQQSNETGLFQYNQKAREITLVFNGGNNSYVNGTYKLIDHGILYTEAVGFELGITLFVVSIVCFKSLKRRRN